MTKKELAAQLKDLCGSQANADKCVDAVFAAITTELANGGKYTHLGFGVFAVKPRAARTGRNPRTGTTMTIPARKGVSFTVGKTLKEAVA